MVTRDRTAVMRAEFLSAMATLGHPRRIDVQKLRNVYVLAIARKAQLKLPDVAVRSWERRRWIVWTASPEKGRKTYEVRSCEG